MHLHSNWISSLLSASQLGPGRPAAPGADHLWLLPSGPDQVHGAPPRRTRPSTSLDEDSPRKTSPPEGIQPRCSGLRVQGTASSPPSTATVERTVVAASGSISRSGFDNGKQLASGDPVACLYVNRRNYAVAGRPQFVVHFHGFDDEQDVSRLHRIAHHSLNVDD